MIAAMLAKACRNEEIHLVSPVRDRINLIHAADLAEAVVAALKREAWGVFNVAGPGPVSIAEIANACVDVAGSGRVTMPANDEGEGTLRYQLDYSKATAAFDYSPRLSLTEGLRRTMADQY
jgi:UDP-glucose 4-epimerase